MSPYAVVLAPSALRDLQKTPPRVAGPLLAFIEGGLAANPRRRGKPLGGDLAGNWGARRGDYRIIYMIEEDVLRILVVRLAHRTVAYRPI